jgi:hypothetical protein
MTFKEKDNDNTEQNQPFVKKRAHKFYNKQQHDLSKREVVLSEEEAATD